MFAHFTMRTCGVNQAFIFAEGIGYIERAVKSEKNRKRPILHHKCATCSNYHLIRVPWFYVRKVSI